MSKIEDYKGELNQLITAKVIADSTNWTGSRVTTLELEYPRYIHSELMTHRCLVGDTLLHFDLPTGHYKNGGKRVYTMSIKDFYTKWNEGAAKHIVGSLDKTIKVDSIEADRIYTAKELANVLGYKSPSNIRSFCRSGRLKVQNPNKSKSEDFLIRGSDYLKLRKNYGVRSFSIKERLKNMQLRCCNTTTHFIDHTHITDIWEVGEKEVFEVKTKSGKSILATADHPFYIGDHTYAEVKDLQVGSYVYIEAMGKAVKRDPNFYNKYNGQWVQTWIRQNKGIISERQDHKCFDCHGELPDVFDIHHVIPRHIDPTKSFDLDNVVALCPECHKKRHEVQDTYNRNGAFLYAKPDEIVSITSKGIQTVYDLSVESSEHNFIANGFIVHNCFSRNAASSRAIPVDKMIDIIVNKREFYPIWTKSEKGMQGEIITDENAVLMLNTEWKMARAHATHAAWNLRRLGIHKQNINRLLEPYQFMKTIVTATEWDNFFRLRTAEDVMPEMQLLAKKMKEAIDKSMPVFLDKGDWHLPYIKGDEGYSTEMAKKISVSCCAQVSYRKLDESPEKALEIFDKLISGKNLHASAFEHVCTPITDWDAPHEGNLKGWNQYRHIVENMLKAGLKP